MKVDEILRRKGRSVITIGQDRSLKEASELLREHNIGVLVVVEGDRPVGILSERDIVRKFAAAGDACAAMDVREAMTPDLIVGSPGDNIQYVMQVMTQRRIRHLPIVDDHALCGLISIGDVVKAQITESEAEIRVLHAYITGVPR